ncbi:uncharacterized protein [Haliotis asinina]|uniref:uncharacterized protein n=1 Tax=Haliotis asinina TaxID=109174 RepID=UPI0035324A22
MGCGKSVPEKRQRRKSSTAFLFNRQKVSIRIGNEVKLHENSPQIIFVFGGPGTKKGKLVEDLIQTFGFRLINLEKLILKELAKDPDEVGGIATSEIIDYVKESPEKITLRWALNEIKKEVEADTQGSYVIDLMPNLRGLVRSAGLVKDPTFELKNFETSFPISFAINFSIPLDKMVKKKNEPECVKAPDAENKKEGGNQAGKSDEADSGRTKRRATLFDSSVRPFVDYFQKSGRLVNIDVSCGMLDLIWSRICEVFFDLQITNCANADTVIIFAFDESTIEEIELGQYCIHRLNLREYIQDPQEPAEKILTSISRVIEDYDPTVKAFAVNLEGTSLDKKMTVEGKRHIMFIDENNMKLDSHVKMQMKGKPCAKNFKALCSLENQICLFPQDTDLELCKNISLFLAKCRLNS